MTLTKHEKQTVFKHIKRLYSQEWHSRNNTIWNISKEWQEDNKLIIAVYLFLPWKRITFLFYFTYILLLMINLIVYFYLCNYDGYLMFIATINQ